MTSLKPVILFCILFTSSLYYSVIAPTTALDQGLETTAEGYYSIGDSLYQLEKWAEAIHFFELSAASFKDPARLIYALNDIGLCYKKIGVLDSAIIHYEESLDISIGSGDFKNAITILRNLGNTHRSQGNYLKALDHYLQSLNYSDSLGRLRSSSITQLAIGNVHENLNRYQLALSAYHKAIESFTDLGDSTRLRLTLNNTGDLYYDLSNFDSAYYYYQRALQIKTEKEDLLSRSSTLSNLGQLYAKVGQQDSAKAILLKAYQVQESINAEQDLAITANRLASFYLNRNKPQVAKKYMEDAEYYAHNQGNQTIMMNNLMVKSLYYQQTNNHKEANKVLKQWAAMRDSSFNQEKLKVIELQSEYDLQQKEAQRQLEEQRADAQSRLAKDRLNILRLAIALAVTFLLFTLVFLYQRIKIRQLNDSLKLLNRDMLHRKRNDYSRLLSSLELAEFSDLDTIRNMLFASTAVDNTLYRDLTKEVNVKTHLVGLIEDLSSSLQLSKKKIQIKTLIQDMTMNGEQLAKISFIINELITNSVKHSFKNPGGQITVKIDRLDKKVTLYYTDDGQPISVDLEKSTKGMGMKLIQGFLKSLRAKLVRQHDAGLNTSKIEFISE